MPKHPTKGTRAGMSATARRTGKRRAPGLDTPASTNAGGPDRKTRNARSAIKTFPSLKNPRGAH